MEKLISDKNKFTGRLITIGLPIFLQLLFMSLLNFIDGFMIGQLVDSSGSADNAISAIGLANQLFIVLEVFLAAISSGAAVFASQAWGKKDTSNIKSVLGISISISCMISFLFAVLAICFPEKLVNLYPAGDSVKILTIQYLTIIGFSHIPMGITFSYSSVLRSIENTKLPLMISVLAICINTVLNYFLIFGKFGFPELGVRGAAIATVIARCVEAFLLVVIPYFQKSPIAGKIKEIFNFNFSFAKKYIKIVLPIIAGEGGWVVGEIVYNYMYFHLGESAFAAVGAFYNINAIFFLAFVGLAESSTIMIGNRIGADERKKAFDYSVKFVILAAAGAIIIGSTIFLSKEFFLSFFKLSSAALYNCNNLLIIFSFVLILKAVNVLLINGIFRAGGDTLFSFKMDFFLVWFVGIPIGLISVFILHLPVYFVFLLINIEELLKTILCLFRFFSKKWLKNLTQR